jgi:very-short-patch-repair endonuclease
MVSDETRKTRKKRAPLTKFARQMRCEPTVAELKFWYQVRDRRLEGFKFKRQIPVGPYIADFICIERRLIVEIDGGQHSESEHDRKRDAFLTSEGYRVLRFWNADVLTNMEGVIDMVIMELGVPPHPALSP